MYCQKCRTPLKLHASLEDQLSPAALDLLVDSSGPYTQPKQSLMPSRLPYPSDRLEIYEKAAKSSSGPIYKRVVPAPKFASDSPSSYGTGNKARNVPSTASFRSLYANPLESFVILTESQLTAPAYPGIAGGTSAVHSGSEGYVDSARYRDGDEDATNTLSHRMAVSAKLFDILSSRSDIDHPICMECTGLLLDGLEKRLVNATKERDAYVEFLKKANAEIPSEEEIRQAELQYENAQAEKEAAIEELRNAEKERMEVEQELKALEEEAGQLDLEEEEFWKERNAFALALEEFQNERDGVNLRYDHDSRQLERLQRTNVYNDTFCIGHDGYFGTINGLRLGRLPNQIVDWPEINAAWGHTLLLLATVAEKLNFTFEGYRLKPMGSMSKIEKFENNQSSRETTKPSVLELYSSGDLPIRVFLHRKFDNAMVAFLDCLKQLGTFVESLDSNLKLPYPIVKDKIGDACIRLHFNSDEEWTRACKHTLTCAKFLLAHASNRRATQTS